MIYILGQINYFPLIFIVKWNIAITAIKGQL